MSERKYWVSPEGGVIPRKEVNLVEFLRKQGYSIFSVKEGHLMEGGHIISRDEKNLGRVMKDGSVHIDYLGISKDLSIVEFSLDLARLLETNEIPYYEPLEREVIKDLITEKEGKLIRRLEEPYLFLRHEGDTVSE